MKILKFGLPAMMLLFGGMACQAPDNSHDDAADQQMQTEERTRMVVETVGKEVYGKNNFDAIDTLFTDDYKAHGEGPQDPTSREEFKKRMMENQKSMENMKSEMKQMLVDGEKAAIYWEASGTMKADTTMGMMEDKQLSFDGITIYQLRDGKIAESWTEMDMLQMYNQMGMMPTMQEYMQMKQQQMSGGQMKEGDQKKKGM